MDKVYIEMRQQLLREMVRLYATLLFKTISPKDPFGFMCEEIAIDNIVTCDLAVQSKGQLHYFQ